MKPVSELNLQIGDSIFIEDETGSTLGVVSQIFSSTCWVKINGGRRTIKGVKQGIKQVKAEEVAAFVPAEPPFLPPAPAPEPEPEPEAQPEPEPEPANEVPAAASKVVPIQLIPLDMDMQPDADYHYSAELTRLLSDKTIKSGELLKAWYEVRPQVNRGVFAPSTRDDLVRAIVKQITVEAPEKIGAIFRRWPNLVQAWPQKLRGWMPWLSMRQAYIAAEISRCLPVQWEPSPGTPLSRQQFDYGFSLCQFAVDHSEDWICIENGQSWRLAKLPFWLDEKNGKALEGLIKKAGEDWLAEVCEDSQTAPYAELAYQLVS